MRTHGAVTTNSWLELARFRFVAGVALLLFSPVGAPNFGVSIAQAAEDDDDECDDPDDFEEEEECRDQSGCSTTTIPQPDLGPLEDLPLAPDSARVDLAVPSFSNPTSITNPLFPISRLHSALLLGKVEGQRFRVETTLLPGTKTIHWNCKRIKALISQYVAFLDERIHEVAMDFYAQADDGAVWYLGEFVFNYEDGVVADTGGTWIAGREGPAAMIMPAHPKVGDAYRPENAPGIVFEEVVVKEINAVVDGPRGPVEGAIVARELHMDGSMEDKYFAPGYGEFLSSTEDSLEALALAVPTDALADAPPAALITLSDSAAAIYEAAGDEEWDEAESALEAADGAWESFQAAGDAPFRLEDQMDEALELVAEAVEARSASEAQHFALLVGLASLDFQLRHLPPADIDRARFAIWTKNLLVDAEDEDQGSVLGDVATLTWIWGRIKHTFTRDDAEDIEDLLDELREDSRDEEYEDIEELAEELLDEVSEEEVGAEPQALDFAKVQVGSPKTLSTSIRNSKSTGLAISKVSLSTATPADYAITRGSEAGTIPGGGTRTIEVTFHPAGAGERLGALIVELEAGQSAPIAVSLVGHGESDVPQFRRGDADGNGSAEITDAIRTLGFLFTGEVAPACLDAADTNDDGSLDLSDAVRTLGYLFLGQAAPSVPGPMSCGTDATADPLDCDAYPNC